MRAVQQIQKAEAFGRVADIAERPHLELARSAHLEQIGPFLLDELESQTDAVHAFLPQLVELAVDRRRSRSDLERQRSAVGKVAPAVSVAIDIAELVEQRPRPCGIEANVAAELRIIPGHVRRDGLRRRLTLALSHDTDLVLGVVRHADRATQRNLVVAVASDDRIPHVEIGVRDRRLDRAPHLHALLREPRLELVAWIEHVADQIDRHRNEVELAVLEREQSRVGFLDDRDLDATNLRQLLAAHARDQRPVCGIAALGKEDVAVTRIRFEHDLLSAPPILEKIRPGTDWIGHRPAACVSVSGNDFARDRCCRRSREIGKQIVRRMFEIEADRVAIDRLHAFDRRVVVELPGLLRGGDGSFRPHDPFIEDQLGDRAHLRIEHPLPGIDVVCSSELALRPFEHRVVGKIDTVLELDGPGLAVG